mmetsp:Transcript_30477/g.96928  ORF Transcript_30477/g.96928 Transcript_30477/m.96928 type:complete len:258 (-) Transcript_30477:12-785(-)
MSSACRCHSASDGSESQLEVELRVRVERRPVRHSGRVQRVVRHLESFARWLLCRVRFEPDDGRRSEANAARASLWCEWAVLPRGAEGVGKLRDRVDLGTTGWKTCRSLAREAVGAARRRARAASCGWAVSVGGSLLLCRPRSVLEENGAVRVLQVPPVAAWPQVQPLAPRSLGGRHDEGRRVSAAALGAHTCGHRIRRLRTCRAAARTSRASLFLLPNLHKRLTHAFARRHESKQARRGALASSGECKVLLLQKLRR